MPEADMIADAADRILSDAGIDAMDRAGGTGAAADALWATLEVGGFTRLWAAEDHGGAGLGAAEAFALLPRIARHGAPLPVADTILAAHLLSRAGMAPPTGALGLLPGSRPAGIAFGARIAHAVMLDGPQLHLLGPLPDAPLVAHAEDALALFDPARAAPIAAVEAPGWMTPGAVRALGAAVRAAQMAGAIAKVLELTLDYTSGREQFGRPLSKFQAIQHHLAEIAGESAAASAAVQMAAEAIADDPDMGNEARAMAAIAKIRCGDAAARVTAAAHQAHGAMGFTHDYALGRFTRRLWQWQDDFGAEAHWAIALGRAHLSTKDAPLWPRITG